MPKPVKGSGRYMAGLDGLRALAVLAVIAYHLNLGFVPGGLLGVGVFFVLSGYLITDLLVSQWDRRGRIDLKDFWFRRARRLLPALLSMLVVVLTWITLVHPSELASLRGDVIAAVLYVSNWWYIYHHVSYFALYGPQSPFTHLWSLAVEEQFYLLWPLVLLVGLKYLPKRRWLIVVVLLAAGLSALDMAVLYHPGTNPDRVYYGTDTRAFSLLIGAAVALAWPSRKLSVNISRSSQWMLDGIGGLGLATIFYMFWQSNQYETFLYRGGMVILSLATAAVVANLAHPASRLSRLLAAKPLQWLGVRSYGLYLWHYPVIVLTTPAVNTGGFDWIRAGWQVGASILLAALSWHFIEEPIRQGALGRWWLEVREKGGACVSLKAWTIGLACLIALSVSVGGISGIVPAAAMTTSASAKLSGSAKNRPPGSQTTSSGQGSPTVKTPAHPTPPNQLPGTGSIATNTALSVYGPDVTAIGDSVMVDAKPYLKQLLPGIDVQARVDRQLYQAPGLVARLKAEGHLGNRVILELGTNGPFSKGQLTSLLKSLGPVKRIVLVNTRVPRPWQTAVNTTLAEVAKSWPNTVLVNWYQDSAHHNSWFYPDGVHPNPIGAKIYAKLLVQALEKPLAAKPPSQAKAPAPVLPSGKGITAIGDSVMVDAKPFLQALLPGINVQGLVGRQLYQTPPLVAQLKAKGSLGKRVIIELGTNGPFTKSQLTSLLKSLGPVKRIVLVNTRVPRPWQTTVNTTLAEVAKTWPHTVLVNWYQDSANHNSWFYPDGVHLNPTGAKIYAKLLVHAVEAPLKSTSH